MFGIIKRLARKRSLRWVGGIAVLFAASSAYVLLKPAPAFPPLPIPNGYDDLIRAGDDATGDPPKSLPTGTSNVAELRAFLSPNREAIQLARVGLSRECGVPVAFSRQALEAHLGRIQPLRKVGRLLNAEGTLAALETRNRAAAESFLDLYRLGQAAARNGLMVDYSLGLAFESMGSMGLANLRAKLTADEDREVLKELRVLDHRSEPPDRVADRERAWYRRSAPSYERLMMWVSGAGERQLKPAVTSLRWSATQNRTTLRLLIADLAVRAFRAEHGTYPQRLAELVPAELDSVPIDPFSGQPLIYRPVDSAYLLYSVGPDGRDDSGTPMADAKIWWTARGDIRLTPP